MPTDLFDTEDCDDSGSTAHVVEPEPAPLIRPLSDWLGDLARLLGANPGAGLLPEFGEQSKRPSKAATAAR